MNWNVPPETWIALGSAALTLLISAAHRRGHRLPLLEMLLDLVQGTSRKEPVSHEDLLEELKRRLPLREEPKP